VAAISAAALLVASTGVGGHRAVHAARGLLVPGGGLIDGRPAAAALIGLLTIFAVWAWLRTGAEWLPVAMLLASAAASAVAAETGHAHATSPIDPLVPGTPLVAAHEFPLVVLVAAGLAALRTSLAGISGFRWLGGPLATVGEVRPLATLRPVDRTRAIAVLALADAGPDNGQSASSRTSTMQIDWREALRAEDIATRARRIGLVARARRGGDPFRIDHAPARAAQSLCGLLDDDARRRLRNDADRAAIGLPASEPGWVRLFDAVLVATALDRAGHDAAGARCAALLSTTFPARRGHRPASCWTPLGLPFGRATAWEHAAATAIAHANGWIDDRDWAVLRRRALGAAARGAARRDDERLIAAGRLWLALIDDAGAARILARPTVCHDPLAVALDHLASSLAPTS
jgi:hypothetical protein